MAAIEEYAEVSKRYQFLSEQMQDAETAKRELEDLITSLTEEMQRIFSESFSVIDRNFQEIFKDLFGGGEARLELTDPEHVLESGIEIKVAPPGKVIKNLISLSGGEQSFVAIAFTLPFCGCGRRRSAFWTRLMRHWTRETSAAMHSICKTLQIPPSSFW